MKRETRRRRNPAVKAKSAGQPDVVVVGATGIDTNIYLPGADVDFAVEANFTENLDCVGQAGGYASRGFARLGKKTALIDAVGDDYHGAFIRAVLKKDGIDTRALFTEPCGTRRSVNMMYRDGRRKNFYDGKGSMAMREEDIPMAKCLRLFSRARLAHFSIVNWCRYLLAPARHQGVVVACDIQDVVDPDDAYRRDFIKAADVLFFSAVNFADPTPLIEKFLASSDVHVVVSGMGASGCAVGTREGVRFFPAVEGEKPVVDTNGAGDSLAVGFLSSYYLDGYSLEDSVLRGQIAARHACSLRGTSSDLITGKALNARFAFLRRD